MEEEARRTEEVIYRICSVCKQRKSISEFNKDKTRKLGRAYICKQCNNFKNAKYREDHKEEIAEYHRGYKKTHKEEIAKRGKKYRGAHKEEIEKHDREYRAEHKEEKAEYHKKYYGEHKEKITERVKRYREAHKDEFTEYKRGWIKAHKQEVVGYIRKYNQTEKGRLVTNCRNQRRRARKAEAEGDVVTPKEFQRIVKNQGGKCNLCSRKFIKSRPPTMDHVFPLSRGGPHTSSNIQALCQSCNSSKHAKIMKCFITSWLNT